jgi:hypothetical protein
MQRRPDGRPDDRAGEPLGGLGRPVRTGNGTIDFSFLCLSPGCHDQDIEVPCGPEMLLSGREVICTVCGAQYRLSLTRAAGTYLILPVQILRN